MMTNLDPCSDGLTRLVVSLQSYRNSSLSVSRRYIELTVQAQNLEQKSFTKSCDWNQHANLDSLLCIAFLQQLIDVPTTGLRKDIVRNLHGLVLLNIKHTP